MGESGDFLQLATERYSVRKFSDREIEKEVLEKILQAGYVAPTACNKQPVRIMVIKSEEGLKKLYRTTECHFHTKTALLICYSKKECWKRSYDGKDSGDVDASIVTTHMMMEAASLGVGTTWVMYFIPDAVRTEFELPEDLVPAAFLMMGYPAEDAQPSPTHKAYRPMEEMISFI